MAIEKTVFTGTTSAANAPEVYEFLNANKAGYFDRVEMDETTNDITCYVGETPALKLGFNDSSRLLMVTLDNGTYVGDRRSNDSNYVWAYGIKTSKGLVLYGRATSDKPVVFISKTNTDSLAVVFLFQEKNSSTLYFCAADIVNGDNFFWAFGAYENRPAYKTGVTSLVNIPLSTNVESYTPDVYLTVFGQYNETAGKLTANGKEYYYTGYIALGD